MARSIAALRSIPLFCFFVATTAFAAPVRTESGLVDGVTEGEVTVWKGIPFAAPPVGDLRWRAPQAAHPWSGVRLADTFSPVCMQRGRYPEDAPVEPMSEDCLYLNVWAPVAATSGAKLPVMFWIYGGGLSNGTASTPLYAGDVLARHGVIVVTANYRMGALGFLAHPALTRESEHQSSGNYGLLDQIAALEWVKRNIAAFGGDPSNVTVFGQSSGSISISVLCASPLARGLFHRAIGQSGGLFEPLELAQEFALAGAEQEGVAFAARVGATTIEALRALPATDLVAARFSPHVVIDGYLLEDAPYDVLAAGRGADVDLLVGSNAEEGLSFQDHRAVTSANLNALLGEDFPPFLVSLAGPRVPADDASAMAAFVAFETNVRFAWDMRAWARLHAGAARGHTYLYRFGHAPPNAAGAHHGAEMAYVFGHALDSRWTDDDRQLAERLGAYWTRFAEAGDPNGVGLPEWPAFTPPNEQALLIDGELHAGAMPNASELDAIGRVYATARFLFAHRTALGAAVITAVLSLLYAAWRAVRSRFRRPATRVMRGRRIEPSERDLKRAESPGASSWESPPRGRL